MAFITAKKKTNFKSSFLSINKQEINGLIIKGVFKFKKYNPIKFKKVYIFKLKIVNKSKDKAINTLFKKLRLII